MKIIRLLAISICLSLLSITIFSQKLVYDEFFTPDINNDVDFVEILDDQKMLIVGDFTMVNGQTRNLLARLNSDGSLDTSFNANWTTEPNNIQIEITSFTRQSDGKMLISGRLPLNGAYEWGRVLRLNSDGSIDNTLTSVPSLARTGGVAIIKKIEPTPDGKMLVCGRFSTANGNSQANIARYNSDGSYDPSFTVAINDECWDVQTQPDGKYLVAGIYTTLNGNPLEGLARFNSNDTIDTSFTAPNFSEERQDKFYRIELQEDGTMYVSHKDYIYGNLLRLNSDGSLMTKFLPKFSVWYDLTSDIEVLPNGKVLAVSGFSRSSNSDPLSEHLNRFTPDGRLDGSLDTMYFHGQGDETRAIKTLSDGKVLVGGGFSWSRSNGVVFQQKNLVRFRPEPIVIKPKYDFDGDGKDDLAVYRPSDRVWYLYQSTAGITAQQFGLSTDTPVVADYDGDGRADIAVFRDGAWYWMRSSDDTFAYGVTGQAGDIPQPGFNGRFITQNSTYPGSPNLLAFRPSEAAFYVHAPYNNPVRIDLRGMTVTANDILVAADYDGDDKEDIAVFNDGNWSYLSSSDFRVWDYHFGLPGDKPVIGDFDGDGRTDYAVFRPSNCVWYIQKSTEGFYAVQWGLSDDLPVPADYDGDGKTDIAVYRDGVWYILHNDNSIRIEQFGLAGDIPAQLR